MKLLISACLLGTPCRYDGKGFVPDRLLPKLSGLELVPVCPEQLGGLPTPRSPSERRGNQVVSRDGADRTAAFTSGATQALNTAVREGCRCALLKERSPSCGSRFIYDGSFSGRVIPGEGVTAALLRERGIAVFSEEQTDRLLDWIRETDPNQKEPPRE